MSLFRLFSLDTTTITTYVDHILLESPIHVPSPSQSSLDGGVQDKRMVLLPSPFPIVVTPCLPEEGKRIPRDQTKEAKEQPGGSWAWQDAACVGPQEWAQQCWCYPWVCISSISK